MRKLVRKLVEKVKANPVRALSFGLSGLTAALAAFGVTDGTLVQVLGQIGLLVGGGEVARAKVTPEKEAQKREASAFQRGRHRR